MRRVVGRGFVGAALAAVTDHRIAGRRQRLPRARAFEREVNAPHALRSRDVVAVQELPCQCSHRPQTATRREAATAYRSAMVGSESCTIE